MKKQTKEFLINLVDKEIREEYQYQLDNKEMDNEVDINYIKELIEVKTELLDKCLVSLYLIDSDIEQFIKPFEKEM